MQTITASEVKERLGAGESLRLIDVREPHEHADFNIGGELIPLGLVQTMQLDGLEDHKEDELIIYCRSGNRSGQACMILESMGFRNVKNLVGGMLGWEAQYGRSR